MCKCLFSFFSNITMKKTCYRSSNSIVPINDKNTDQDIISNINENLKKYKIKKCFYYHKYIGYL